jgi:hypothetical protein
MGIQRYLKKIIDLINRQSSQYQRLVNTFKGHGMEPLVCSIRASILLKSHYFFSFFPQTIDESHEKILHIIDDYRHSRF